MDSPLSTESGVAIRKLYPRVQGQKGPPSRRSDGYCQPLCIKTVEVDAYALRQAILTPRGSRSSPIKVESLRTLVAHASANWPVATAATLTAS